ncbi:hypothetical protein FGADI_9529 [Fusarium gaditjirri]|uniref:Oxidoreductase acuF-like C2H2 type zinc-finger domain-containing protein n=1 Tax=Fusarium gaditjirri TaxID=282569 RepID=A0A8H4SZP0_9HYPO|nr:hypothetical protein FGADI_9529 [Fusarium gaditjirri]
MSAPVASEELEAFSQATIADCAKSCLESFQQCLNDASKADKVISSLVSKLSLVRIEDQLARFSLWAANLRVFSTSRYSLDSRLREASDVKDAIIGLLQALDYRAKTCARFLVSISTQSTGKPVEDSLEGFDNTLDELRNEITLLHKTSNTIRRASKEIQNIKAAEVFKIRDDEGNDAEPFLRQLFVNYIRDRFPGTNEEIRKRLADTMLLRRKRILYRKERYGKSSIRLPEAVAKPVISHPRPEPREEITQGSVKRRAVEAPSQSHIQSVTKTATTLSPEKFKKAAAPSVISVSRTVALSSTDKLCFPPPPTAGLMRKYNKAKKEIEKQEDDPNYSNFEDEERRQRAKQAAFKRERDLTEAWKSCIEAVAEVTCPYCFHILPIRDVIDENKWKLHVKNDLDPYICLFEKCDSPDHLYSHSSAWVKHMKEHTLRWRCKAKAHGEFLTDNKTDYVEHMRTSHPGKFTQAQLGVLADRNAHTSGALFTTCPLCGIEKTDTPMEHHVVGHMRLLALKSLPAAHEEMNELVESEGQHDSLATSQPHTNSTIKHGLEAYYDEDEAGNLVEDIESNSYSSGSDAEDGSLSGQQAPSPEFEEIQREFMPDMQDSGQDQQNDPILQSFLQRALRDKGSSSNSIPPPGAVNGDKKKKIFRMDPDCAICGLPGSATCICEAKALDIALTQAESRMMGPLAQAVRRWVQDNAQGYMDRNPTKRQATLNEVDNPHQKPDQQKATEDTDKAEKLEYEGSNEVEQSADVDLPEVLDYYFGLVELTLPGEDEPAVRDPPLGTVDSYEEKESNPFKKSSYSKGQNNSLNYSPDRLI